MENFDFEKILARYRILIVVVFSICAVISGVVFFQKNQSGEEYIRFLTQEEIVQIREINQAGLDANLILIDIEGQVVSPGVIEVRQGASLLEIVDLAGGFTEEADMYYIQKEMNLAKLVEDREKIYIPSVEEGQLSSSSSSDSQGGDSNGLVNINSATIDELDSLTGIGPATAESIVEARPFGVIEDIMEVPGIGESTFEKIKDNIRV